MALPYVTASQAEKIAEEKAREIAGGISSGIKLYKHVITDSSRESDVGNYVFISQYNLPLNTLSRWNDCRNQFGFPSISQTIDGETLFCNFNPSSEEVMITIMGLGNNGMIVVDVDEDEILFTNLVDEVSPLE